MRAALPILLLFALVLCVRQSGVYAQEEPPADNLIKIEHSVKPNEQLHVLAAYYLLDPRRWPELLDWNRGSVKNKNLLQPGQVLVIWVDPEWEPPFDLDAYMNDYRKSRR